MDDRPPFARGRRLLGGVPLSGKNLNGYSARPGWDPVTGWGSPNAQVLVPLLGKEVRPDDGQGL